MSEKQLIEKLDRYKRRKSSDNLIMIPILDAEENTVGFFETDYGGFQDDNKWVRKTAEPMEGRKSDAFPTRFHVTEEGTEKWINNLIICNDRRILFMVQDIRGNYIGHMGFAGFDVMTRSAAVDLVVRGEKNTAFGLMECAVQALVRWGKQELGLEHISLDVLWDNVHAISFYERCGFRKGELIPLTKEEAHGEIRWMPHRGAQFEAEKYYLHMTLC